MADLRIVDAPLLYTVKGTEKIPTGGEGNFSVSVNQVADFAKLKWFLATEEYVDNAVGNVQADLNLHKNNVSNPHQVSKGQVGLGNVDNTADLDKPVSNATQSAIITANSGKADKSYVDSQDQLKADKNTVEASLLLKADKFDLKASKITSDGDQNQQQINDFGGAKWYAKVGGYGLGATVKLDNGGIVKSNIPNNTVNPNVGMTGWVEPITEKIKQYNFPIISARDFGVKGDGSSGDQAKISEAYEYLNSIGGGTLYLPNGTYLIEDVNYVDETPTAGVVGLQEQYAFPIYSNITVLGQSRENTIFKMADGIIYKDLNRANLGCALFADAHKVLHVKNFRLERFKVDMNGVNNPVVNLPTGGVGGVQQAIFPVLYYFDYYHSTNITVDNIWVHQNTGMNSIYIGHKSTQSVISNCLFTDHSDYVDGNTLIRDHSTIYIAGLNNLVTKNIFVMGHDPVTINERTKTSYVSTAIEAHGVNTIVSENIVDGYAAPFLAASTEWYNGDSILFIGNKAYQAQIGFSFASMRGQLKAQFIGNTVTLRKAKASTADNYLRYAHAAIESAGAINSVWEREKAYAEIYVLNNVFEQEEPDDWTASDNAINVCHHVKEAKLFVSKGNIFKNFKGAALGVLVARNLLLSRIELDSNTYINCGENNDYTPFRAAYLLNDIPFAVEEGYYYNLLDRISVSNDKFIDCKYGVLLGKANDLTARRIDITGVKYLGSFIPPILSVKPIDMNSGHLIHLEYETDGFVTSGQSLADVQGVSGKIKMRRWSSSSVDAYLLKNFEYVKTAYYPWNMQALSDAVPSATGQFGAFPNKNGDRVDLLTPVVNGFSSFVRFNSNWYGTGKIDATNIIT